MRANSAAQFGAILRNSAQFSDAPRIRPGTTGTCDATKEGVPVVTNSGFTDVPTGDEDALKSAVAQQACNVQGDSSVTRP